ncbi:glycoside hydrolase family 43 protein [Pseudofrankia inefficax]|uniref:Xylan 1,4-beta-xylosidase n=1 Tax=Pseudofrankia inefficax (strain DSM 45817 / CECT 9037 / DDB 130130 / EuI1c) TaxID=298654 RepID=E3IXZ2_PSEI1|nr:glycoside hydrolase family 43 protein [Pseudofrankia inefficax]ADP81447.1 Xylan 1,4-beta-xylosidase [Pseudofrankia inefficax]
MNVNPILPGFYPDPSICRVGGDYFVVTSSFEYFPGVPIFHSTDLVSWEQIGNVLDRPSQLHVAPGLASASTGIFAPTLRHHDGRFWLTTTNFADVRRGHLIVQADDPAGDWTDPVYTAGAIGIDPDLAWDDDGTCHLTWCFPGQIRQAAVDPDSGKLLSEPRALWSGTGLAHPEGPHLFRRDGWWYLVLAEGGTDRGHAVSIARSRLITGPFTGNPANPILTRGGTEHPVQSTGHADLVELSSGEWAMVHLGVRPRGTFPLWHVNGRESFLTGIDWADGWPVVVEDRLAVPVRDNAFTDEFRAPPLHPRWISPGTDPRTFTRHRPGGGLVLAAGRTADAADCLLAVRARDLHWLATVDLAEGDARLTVRIDDAHWVAVERRADGLAARMVVGPLDQVLATANGIGTGDALAIRAVAHADAATFRAGPDQLELGYLRDGEFRRLATVDGRYLSTEVAGGFTGRVIGVEALATDATLTRFAYQALA